MDDGNRRHWMRQFRLVGEVLSFVVSCALLLIVANPLMSRLAGKQKGLAIATATMLGAFALTIVFTRFDGWSLEKVGAKVEWRSLPRMIFGVAVGLLIVGAWAAATYATCGVRWQRVPETSLASVVTSTLAYLLLAGREELAFHGYPLRRLHSAWGVWPAQLFIAA